MDEDRSLGNVLGTDNVDGVLCPYAVSEIMAWGLGEQLNPFMDGVTYPWRKDVKAINELLFSKLIAKGENYSRAQVLCASAKCQLRQSGQFTIEACGRWIFGRLDKGGALVIG